MTPANASAASRCSAPSRSPSPPSPVFPGAELARIATAGAIFATSSPAAGSQASATLANTTAPTASPHGHPEDELSGPDESLPLGLMAVGDYASPIAAQEHGLVILAMGQPYWLVPTADRFVLLVETAVFAPALLQLQRFRRESLHWPPAPLTNANAPAIDFLTPALWVLLIVATFLTQSNYPTLRLVGALESHALFNRAEWWRPVTALFLHADAGHLVANAGSGFLVFLAVLATFGRLRGWLLVTCAAIVGNIAAAAAQARSPYSSIGASTAIFGGLGLLTGRAIAVARHAPPHQRAKAVWVSLGTGLCVLALYGAGGPNVDLGAHLGGFISGLLIGLTTRQQPPAKIDGPPSAQTCQ